MESVSTPAPRLPSAAPAPAPRRLPSGQGASFWSEAWRIFCAAPVMWIALLAAYVVISLLLVVVPVLGSLVQTVLSPVFVGGVMLGCHALARGEPLEFRHLFAGFRDGHFAPLAILGLVVLALFIVVGIVVAAFAFVAIGMTGIAALAQLDDPRAWTTLAGMSVGIMAIVLICTIGASLVWMAFWFAPALVVLDGVEPIAALKASFDGWLANMGPALIFGLVYLGLAIVASIPFGLGWIVLAPMSAASAYASWRQVFAR